VAAASVLSAPWPIGLAAAGARSASLRRARAALRPRRRLLPLAALSLGLAALYAVLAIGWAALSWRDARGLLLTVGPLLARSPP
jgi:hypothetical protein